MSQNEILYPARYADAVKERIIANARKTFCKTYEDHAAIYTFLMDHAWSSFYGSLLRAFEDYGKLTPKQVEVVRRGITREASPEWKAQQAERAAANGAARVAAQAALQHVGKVGDRITVTLTVKKQIEMQGPSFGWGDTGMSYLYLCEDSDGNVFKYKGQSVHFPAEGKTATIVATIKAHEVYKDVKQTVLTRPALPKESS